MALQGASWQELQGSSAPPTGTALEHEPPTDSTEALQSGSVPPTDTALEDEAQDGLTEDAQSSSASLAEMALEDEEQAELAEVLLKPRELTAIQKKKLARFERQLAKDAGDVLHTIKLETILPIEQEVTWDQDPELLCSYNWKASTDGTNTIFGKSPSYSSGAMGAALLKIIVHDV